MDMDFYQNGERNGRVICGCSCSLCGSGLLPSVVGGRSLKRKMVEMEEKVWCERKPGVGCVGIENEVAALRKAVDNQQQAIHKLHSDLEEERAAAATAASEAMSMILRIQREKADAQMDARQFKLFAEEKMVHDQQEMDLLEDLLFQRDEVVQSLSCEVQAYRHRLLSIGTSPFLCQPSLLFADDDAYPAFHSDYGDFLENGTSFPMEPGNKYASSDTPRERFHRNRPSVDSFGSPSYGEEICKNKFPANPDHNADDGGRGGFSDLVYTIDAVRGVDSSTPVELVKRRDWVHVRSDEVDIKKLHMRLQALEEENESARQAILSLGKDKARVMVLEQIAQKMPKEATLERRSIKKPSFLWAFSLFSALKWVASFFFWRKKSSRIRYTFGISSHNVGLLILLEKSQAVMKRRCRARVQR